MSGVRGNRCEVHLQVKAKVKTLSGSSGALSSVSDLKNKCIGSVNINTWIKVQQLKDKKSSKA